jgi:putative ABC transport system permease protein
MHLESSLREGGGRISSSHRAGATRSLFILAQAAVTLILLATASLLVLSYRSMMSADTGFANRDTVSMNLQLRGPGMFSGQVFDAIFRRAFYTQLLNRLREAPGVTSAAAVLLRPLEGTIGWDVPYEFEFEAATSKTSVLPKVNYEVVTPGYFRTVGTPILEGRDFDEHDSEDGDNVVIVSRTLAQRIRVAGHSPVGHRLRLGLNDSPWFRIVGVTADARYRNITQAGADIFASYLQASQPTNYVVIRGTQPSRDLAALTRTVLSEIDSSQAIAGVATIGELIDRNAGRHRFNMIVLLWFAVCSAILAAAGVYSVIAETMAAREREIAIRSALGAQRIRLVREMVSGTLGCVVAGEVTGAILVCALEGFTLDLLHGVSARDPRILGSAAAFLFIVSLWSALWPAWIAAGVDPKNSLRRR